MENGKKKNILLFVILSVSAVFVLLFAAAYIVPPNTAQEIEQIEIAETLRQSTKIDINHATKEQLCMLSGIGEKKAERIIEYRISVGGFDTIEEMAEVSGITEKMVIEWGEQVYLSPMNE